MTGARREARLQEVVEVARVPAVGDPTVAVARIPEPVGVPTVECEVLVVGGGTGGVAAAFAAARRGRRVCLAEETDWLGGQLTSQGVSALDEHVAWVVDVSAGHPSFTAVQTLVVDGRPITPASLAFGPDDSLSAADWRLWGGEGEPPPTRAAGAQLLFEGLDPEAGR